METRQFNLVLVSDSQERIDRFHAYLNDPQNKIHTFSFYDAFTLEKLERPFDLIVIDYVSFPEYELNRIALARSQFNLDHIPFIFILYPHQETLKKQLYKNPHNKIAIEPVDRFVFISTLASAIHVSDMERKLLLYQDIIEGEKKLISNMDQLLELHKILHIDEQEDFLLFLEKQFIKRIELALAVETALFTRYDEKGRMLIFNQYDSKNGQLVRRYSFSIKKSMVKQLLQENYSQIFDQDVSLDPFAQELEEALGIKVFSLLFIPITVLHQPRGAIILINKLYRDEFTENDLSFSIIAGQKLTFHLERIELMKGSMRIGIDDEQRKELALYKNLMNSVEFGVIIFDHNYKITYYNKAVTWILKREFVPSKLFSLEQIFNKNEFSKIKSVIDANIFPAVRQELQLDTDDTINLYIGFSIYPLREEALHNHYALVFSEISQTKRIQSEIIRMDRMASLGVLSSGIAHEIRNPLAGIKAMAQTLEEELEDNPLHLEYVQRIIRQVNRLDELLKSFFTYARPTRPDPSPMQIADILREVLPLVKPRTQQNHVQIEEIYADDLLPVFVDANQIQQVFLNLILNAIDAIHSGGKITIAAQNAEAEGPLIDRRHPTPKLLSDTFLEIKIKDTGQGIPKPDCDKIFNPFYTTKTNGTGLGLSIVYQIIREHGGRITVESEVNQGSVFTILLPALQDE